MAKSNLKSSASTAALSAATNGKKGEVVAFTVPEIRKSGKNSAVLALIESALRAARTMVQSVRELEPKIAKASQGALEHFDAHGDMGPADRLVKGLIACNHPTTTTVAREVMAWFKACSPIQWEGNGKGKVFKNKDEDKGQIETDLALAEEKAYFETPQAIRARQIGAAAQNNALKAADLGFMVNRLAGTIKTFNNMLTGSDQRKVKAGEVDQMTELSNDVNKLLKKYGGAKAIVPVAEVTKAELAKVTVQEDKKKAA
jgi:hypothetical protein